MSDMARLLAASAITTGHRAAHKAKLAMRRAVLMGVAGILALMGVVYLSIGVHAALDRAFGPVVAGLSVGAGLIVLGLLVLMIALVLTRTSSVPVAALPPQSVAIQAALSDAGKLGPALPVAALVLGFLAGRKR